MPVHKSVWNKLHRALTYTATATVGFHGKTGNVRGHIWGVKGVKKLNKIFADSDKARSHEFTTWTTYKAKFDQLIAQRQLIFGQGAASKAETNLEIDWLTAIVREYFNATPNGQASFVKTSEAFRKAHRGPGVSLIKRIELYDPTEDSWNAVWSMTDE